MMDSDIEDSVEPVVVAARGAMRDGAFSFGPVEGRLSGVDAVAAVPAEEDELDDEPVSCVFTWAHGGHEVYLTGSFHNWQQRIRMVKAGHEFVTVLDLPRGHHLYKFVVDDMWKFAPDQDTATDEHGYVNNVIDITDHKRFRCVDLQPDARQAMTGLKFHQDIPDASEYTTDAPSIPLLFSKVQCPAAHPPPALVAPLHGVANYAFHDASVTSTVGPHASVTSCVYRWTSDQKQNYVISIYATLSPSHRKVGLPSSIIAFDNSFREFAQTLVK